MVEAISERDRDERGRGDIVALSSLESCGGGGGSCNVNCTVVYTHEELAQIFVDRLWTDLGYDIELVKANTLQYDYIVVYDYDLGQYDAYYIGDYIVGENLGNYLNFYENDFFYDLIDNFDGTYDGYDPFTGLWITFDKNKKLTSASLARLVAQQEKNQIGKAAQRLSNQYGVTLSTATEIATATYAIGQEVIKNGTGSLTRAESKNLYQAVLGVDPAQGEKAFAAYALDGNKAPLKSMLDQMIDNYAGKEDAATITSIFTDISGISDL